ncbi:hypothetical protein DICPUDRAFT_97231 [Dictyostelium purpureum]|uniref:Fatty acid hydroxylase domain-containing protein n=1 Tax=Dictyostelium purpureum TaxID=5786 RepID=F0ZEX5_DICPU|nr:uncharacterized protein DICPUDRAFT_97231 [Dictyostelium purpureum]EGC37505.1 hypothetical protein DICPUDRAFT_97231 [Dictyostelium purpureum]|eukprot:XP_003285979.1 hypothetical protein DICPUDRAFT_97231 [Dictyostelium purpureum]
MNYQTWDNYRLINEFSNSFILNSVLSFLLIDISIYWFHILEHKTNIFWAFHLPHHSSDYYGLQLALRQSIIVYFVFWIPFIFYMPFLVHPYYFSLYFYINRYLAFFSHTRMLSGINIKYLDLILVTPSVHEIHHASNKEYIDTNFGSILIIWDRIFGTFQDDIGIKIELGISGIPNASNTMDWINFNHFGHMYRISKRLKGLHKLKVLYKSPGWLPEHQYDEKDLHPKDKSISKQPVKTIAKKKEPNSVLSFIMSFYLLSETAPAIALLFAMGHLKYYFSNMDYVKIMVLFLTQILFVSFNLENNNNNPIIRKGQNSNKKQSFFGVFKLFSIFQLIRLFITLYYFYTYIIYDTNDNNIIYIFNFLFYYTAAQILLWLYSINTSFYNIIYSK